MLDGLFGSKKMSQKEYIEGLLNLILEKGGFALSFEVEEKEEVLEADVFGEDEGLLKAKEGRFLRSLQVYLQKALNRKFQEESLRVEVDSGGFWKEKEEELLDFAEKMIQKALNENRPVTLRKPLSPKERRLIHERASGNTGVRSESLGEGFFKTMKLTPDTFQRDR